MCAAAVRLQSTVVGKTVENFPPQWRAAAQWKSRGAETLVALQAQSPSGLKKAAQALQLRRFRQTCTGQGDHSACRRGGGAGTAR